MNRPIAVGLLVVCTALWGLAFVFQKGAMQHMQPLTFAGVRYWLGSFLVLPLAIWEFRRRTAAGVVITRQQWVRIGILSLAFFLGVWLQQVALLTTSVTNGGFITSLYVIFTPVVTYIIRRPDGGDNLPHADSMTFTTTRGPVDRIGGVMRDDLPDFSNVKSG